MDKIIVLSSGKLLYKGKEYKCAFGPSGVVVDKKEGDGATPSGCFPLREIYYRKDRIPELVTGLPIKALAQDDGWCEDSDDENYNKFIKLPYQKSSELLWRDDNIYDIIVVIGYNDNPVVKGKGSAIFMHVARENYSPTAGCVALKKSDLMELLKLIDLETIICIEI